jgi:serine/threonine-protein kinase RsbW
VSIPSDVSRISPLVNRLMELIELASCVPGQEFEVEMALREALNNAVVHGNRMDPRKRVHVHCRCGPGDGVSIVVRDEGNGFDPSQVPCPTPAQALYSYCRRGIYIMKFYMDEVTFQKGGAEVHLLKRAPRKRVPRKPRPALRNIDHAVPSIPQTVPNMVLRLSGRRPMRLTRRRDKTC